ncbi:hypothetical protein [Actinoallomurus sp. CA-142502]|uniref:hypothetical protein n=1 Tax=Actinoallomurus sp. CA-142502 TaxID=3239885 RepID=UPI003D8A9473
MRRRIAAQLRTFADTLSDPAEVESAALLSVKAQCAIARMLYGRAERVRHQLDRRSPEHLLDMPEPERGVTWIRAVSTSASTCAAWPARHPPLRSAARAAGPARDLPIPLW